MKMACLLFSVRDKDGNPTVLAVAPNDNYFFVATEQFNTELQEMAAEAEKTPGRECLGALFTTGEAT